MLFVCLLLTLSGVCAAGPAEEVSAILTRLLGDDLAQKFVITIEPGLSVDGKDTFRLSKAEGDFPVNVVGSSGVAAAWGAHHYLTHHCGAHVSWDGDQLNLPSPLPAVDQLISSLDKYKYYQNVCTSSYSFVWWDWPRWEREIDWMALKGINLALAFGGQEAIWRRVFDGLGVVNDNFTGPAFLAWGRMGNIRSFGGGLSRAWHNRSIVLQHQILDRMRILGITPILPAFNGILPPSFRNVYPSATGTNISRWNTFPDESCCPFLLDPSDPLFKVVSRLFLREYIAEFGTNHIYNCDTFNENNPDSNDVEYLAAVSRTIYEGMLEADPAAVWMLQGWAFLNTFWGTEQVKAFVTSVPLGRMLILDLQSDLTPLYESFDSYYGQPFIWCTLHNFGGQLGLYGHLNKVNKGIVRGRTFPNSTMTGIGITPEGIDQNYIMYEFTLNGTLHQEEKNMTDWVKSYVRRRYGFSNNAVEEAWEILRTTVYDYNLEMMPFGDHIAKNILIKRPSLSLTEDNWYQRQKVLEAFQLFVEAASQEPSLRTSSLFEHDTIDVARQVVQAAVGVIYQQVVKQFRSSDESSFNSSATMFTDILKDLDVVLSTDSKFLLGRWLEASKAAASNEAEAATYEWNARNQITLWGPSGEIRDYAAKQWSGMIKDFYLPRWQLFLDALGEDLAGTSKYNRTAVNLRILNEVELPFTFAKTLYSVEPSGDPFSAVFQFNETWTSRLQELFSFYYSPPTVQSYSEFQSKQSSL